MQNDIESNLFSNKGTKILYSQKIFYKSKVKFSNRKFSEINFYSRNFKTNKNYNLVKIEMCIPFTGLDTAEKRARIVAYIDNEVICDLTIHTPKKWLLRPIYISGFSLNVNEGKHRFKIKACVESGNLYIPYVESGFFKKPEEPKKFCSLLITGIN